MRIVLFYHSLISDWNHGNAHFLRGIVAEMLDRGHDVVVYEPANGWSRQQLLADAGPEALARFHAAFDGGGGLGVVARAIESSYSDDQSNRPLERFGTCPG